MLFNKKTNKKKKMTDCLECKYFDRKNKKCNGLDKNCFVYDPKTMTMLDSKTGLPIKKI